MTQSDITIRPMTIDDYDQVYALWEHINGFALRSVDDSREGIARFLDRNPNSSVVAELNGQVIGSILCGHDGRQGSGKGRTYRVHLLLHGKPLQPGSGV